jgi:hypothetical protein
MKFRLTLARRYFLSFNFHSEILPLRMGPGFLYDNMIGRILRYKIDIRTFKLALDYKHKCHGLSALQKI